MLFFLHGGEDSKARAQQGSLCAWRVTTTPTWHGDNLKLLPLVDDITVRGSADPLAVSLSALDHRPDFLAGVGDGHLVDDELKLDLQLTSTYLHHELKQHFQ